MAIEFSGELSVHKVSKGLRLRTVVLAFMVAMTLPLGAAHAFSDNEARKAILDLRKRVDEQRQTIDTTMQQQANSILSLSTQVQELRGEVATLRGRVEELERISEQQVQNNAPKEVSIDGLTFTAQPQETDDYNAALDLLRNGDYAGSATLFESFLVRWPSSGYFDIASFWLGNAQYGNMQYKAAVKTFTDFVQRSPNHVRAPEVWLALANCQLALKNKSAERAALDTLIQKYPQSSAAADARKRLAQL